MNNSHPGRGLTTIMLFSLGKILAGRLSLLLFSGR